MVDDRPKALATVSGRPFLAWQLDALAAQGVTHTVLCTHYLSKMIEAEFPVGRLPNGMTIAYSCEPKPLGTGGALRLGLEAIAPDVDLVLGVNGDTFCAFDLTEFLNIHHTTVARASILLAPVDDIERYGSVDTENDGRVILFREKVAARATPHPGWINAGIYLLSRSLLTTLPTDRAVSIERDAFPQWVGHGLYAHRGGSRFLDIGTPESYLAAQAGPKCHPWPA